MEDSAKTLIDQITATFRRLYQESGTVAELLGKVRSGTATYAEAQEYAAEVSRLIGKAWQTHISSAVLPEGQMRLDLSRQLLPSALDENYAMVADYAAQVQQALNTKAGLGLKARTSVLNPDRVDGLATLASRAEQYDEAAGTLTSAMETLMRSAVDDTLRENVEFQGKAGLSPRVIRTASGKCCAWCRALAGTYTYPNVPQDVYRRHENCRCLVEYDTGGGLRQNVHTKQWTADADTLRKRIGLALTKLTPSEAAARQAAVALKKT